MEDIKYDINKEYDKVVDKVSERFGYDDDLKNVLKKVLPSMLEGCSYEDRFLFYKMLSHTQIVTIEEGTQVDTKELNKKYIGNLNPHIQEENVDIGEYGKQEAAGAFVSEPILDENLNLNGVKQVVYVTATDINNPLYGATKKRCELFKTGINVPHLLHELGHAWGAEENQYKIENNILVQRCGTAKIKFELIPQEDGKYIIKEISREGLMTEESLNTNMEIESVARYLGITIEECKELYKSDGCLIPSDYFGMMSEMTEYLSEWAVKKELKQWRFYDDSNALKKINSIMENTLNYKNRLEENENFKKKKEIFDNPLGNNMTNFFERCKSDFFPDKTNMTPMQVLDNTLLQCYDIAVNRMCFSPFIDGTMYIYSDLVGVILKEGYEQINDTIDIIVLGKEMEKETN